MPSLSKRLAIFRARKIGGCNCEGANAIPVMCRGKSGTQEPYRMSFWPVLGSFRRFYPALSRIWAVMGQGGAVEEGHTPGPSTVVNLGMLFWRLDCFLCTTPHFQANNHLLDSLTLSISPSGNSYYHKSTHFIASMGERIGYKRTSGVVLIALYQYATNT
jgi:hypothetical protein